jgi:hypothetical protein
MERVGEREERRVTVRISLSFHPASGGIVTAISRVAVVQGSRVMDQELGVAGQLLPSRDTEMFSVPLLPKFRTSKVWVTTLPGRPMRVWVMGLTWRPV